MFEDDEIEESIDQETSRRAGKLSPEERAKWKRCERRLKKAMDDGDEHAFWDAASDFGIVPGSRRYERLRKLARLVF